ncbi:MAG: LytTR family DNA-binding domain-containing protein [bacterium]
MSLRPSASPIRIVIADDEPAARRRLRRLLATEPDCVLVGEFGDGASALSGIHDLKPDVALLDIQMPERNGLDVAQAIARLDGPAIVFVTAFDQYALRAFDVHAVDYLVKPVDAARLHNTLERIRARLSDATPAARELARLSAVIESLRQAHAPVVDPVQRRFRDRLLVSVEGRSIMVPTVELDWIEAAGNYVRLHRGSSALMMRESLASIEASLDQDAFVRVHRGAIVNVARIKEMQPWFSGAAIIILVTGQRLTVSRSHRKQFEARFGIPGDD